MKSKRIRATVLLGAAFLVSATRDLHGWGKTWIGLGLRHAVESAKWKVGPLRIDPVFYLTDAGYDSNLYYGRGGTAVHDFTATVGPGFSVYLPIKKTLVLQVVESPRYVYFLETKSERAWNNVLSARVNLALNRVFMTAGLGFTSARQRWNTEIDIRPRRREKALQGAALWQTTKRTSFYAQASRTNFRFEDRDYDTFNLRERLDRTEDRLSLHAYVQATPDARFFAGGEYGRFVFEGETSRAKDSRSYRIFGGVDFSPLGGVRGQIDIGYKVFEPVSRTGPVFRGLAGDSRISIRLLRPLTVRTSYRRDVQLSVWYNNAYFVETRTGGGASLYLFRRFRLDYDYTDGHNRYPESQSQSVGLPLKRRDDYRIHSAGLYFRLNKTIAVGLVANRWNRDSNLVFEVDDRDFIGLNLTYDF